MGWTKLGNILFGSKFVDVCICFLSEPVFKDWERFPPDFWLLLKKHRRYLNMGLSSCGGNWELEWWVCRMRHTLPHLPRSLALPVFFPILRPTPKCFVSWTLQCYFSYIHWLQVGAGPHELGDIPSLWGSSSSVSSEKEKNPWGLEWMSHLLSGCYNVRNTVDKHCARHDTSLATHRKFYQEGIITPSLQMGKVRLRKFMWSARSHPVSA